MSASRIVLKNVRLAFPNLFTAARVNGEGEPAFSAAFLFPPGHPAEKQLNDAITATAKAKWADKAPAILKAARATDKVCLHNGDSKSQYSGFEGNLFVSARSKVRPGVYARDTSPLTAEDGKPYAGCYVNAIIELWAQDNKYGKRVNATLCGVQFVKDGDAFGGSNAPASADELEDLGEDDAADVM
jgi:hypothetical protein